MESRLIVLILFCIAISYTACHQTQEDLYDAYFEMEDPLPSDLNTGDIYFRQGMDAYRIDNFKLASELFQDAHSLMVGFDTLSYYIGMSEIGMENYARARSFFEVAEETGDGAMKQKAAWHSALLAVKLGKLEAARNELTSIARNEEHPYQSEADRLLKYLD